MYNDRNNKLLNNTFLIIYLISIGLYISFFCKYDDSSIILKTYEINGNNSILKKMSFTSVEYKENKFSIPDNYSYEIDNGIIIYNNSLWVANIQIIDYSYEDILKYSDCFLNEIREYNYNIKSVETIILDNYDLLVIKIDENNHVLLYTKLDNYKSFAIEISYMDGVNYKEVMEELIDIIKTTTKSDKNNISNSF